MKAARFLFLFLAGFPCFLFAQTDLIKMSVEKLQFQKNRSLWVDSVFNRLSEEEKIAQLFMVAAYSNRDESHKNEIAKLVEQYRIGGLIFFQGSPYKQAQLTNYYQSLAKVPLLIAIDGEWGLGMRLDSTISFPRQLTLGAIPDNKLVYQMGQEIARQCKRMGIHINFAPVVDINSNPANPVINDRSFGEDKFNVSLKGLAYMDGLQDGGVMACAKHFPGHGDTDQDSHLTLPTVKQDRQRLDEVELYPFKILISNGVQSIMAAHLNVPALDSTPNLATSLSEKVLNGLLKKELGFEGLVFSDALNMKGVSAFYEPGMVDLKAFYAGNDILLFAENVPRAIDLFKDALKKGIIKSDDLNARVKKILSAKYTAGLYDYKPVELTGLTEDLNNSSALLLKRKLFEDALTVARNDSAFIPFRSLDTLTFASLSLGTEEPTEFENTLDYYALVAHFRIANNASAEKFNNLIVQLSSYKTVIVALHGMNKQASKNYGLETSEISFIKTLSEKTKVVLTIFGSPYSLKNFEGNKWILIAYEDNETTQTLAAQLLFGAIPSKGVLPVTASQQFKYGMGISTIGGLRLKYTIPEETGIHASDLDKIDLIVLQAIMDKTMPGCQVLVAKEGKVIYNKSFGYHTYDAVKKVKNSDLYDIASITKIAATTLSLMYLYDKREFQLNRKLSEFIPGMENSTLKNLIVRDVLIHQAGLQAWIPFYQATLKDSLYNYYFSSSKTGPYNIQVAENFYMRVEYIDTIYKSILNSPVKSNPEYLYSDIGFYLFRLFIENITKQPFENFTKKTFYSPLGLPTLGFKPLENFTKERIIPTEDDKAFRKQLIWGYVHDPGAAMLGGVSGHAGLFSNANDLAVIMQMLLNRGEYGGQRFLDPTTVSLFTKKNEEKNRRGLGFDKPEIDIYKAQPTAKDASPRTFGHTGFTGTCMWADPDYDLIYVFLSNRINPSADNTKLIKNNIRTEIHQAIYDAIKKSGNPGIVNKSE